MNTLFGFDDNKGADQLSLMSNLISAFNFLERIMFKNVYMHTLMLYVVSVAEKAGVTFLGAVPEDEFSRNGAYIL